MNFMKLIYRVIKGRLNCAIEEGMTVEPEVTVMGGVDFGSEPYLITLKRGARISSDVRFINHDGGTWAFRNTWDKYEDVVKYGRITVGEFSFVGAGSTIMPGVHIGKNCVIAAGSVVTHDVPDEMVCGGIPARPMCSTLEYAEKSLKKMEEQFSDFDKEAYDRDKKTYLLGHLKE